LWPRAQEISAAQLRTTEVDAVVLQRPEELALCADWLGREPGKDVPAVYVEHNTPRGDVPDTRHPLAGRGDLPLVHVTHFNNLMWNSGNAPTTVIEHGVADPGYAYTGTIERAAVVINEPVRRWRVTGTDLLPAFADAMGLDVFGMGGDQLRGWQGLTAKQLNVQGDLPTGQLHAQLARRRLYVHPLRWTSLGLSLIEAMMLGMPVVAVASTEAIQAVPADAGVLSTNIDDLVTAVAQFRTDREMAVTYGKNARAAALAKYSLSGFLRRWDDLLAELVR
jgi:glycosyltransferase involved in cell wall biosynthesis